MKEAFVVLLGALAVAVEIVAVLGVVVLGDAFDRLHYVSLASLGGLALGGAIFVQEGPSLIAIKGGLTALVLVTTSPVLTHATARALHARRGPEAG